MRSACIFFFLAIAQPIAAGAQQLAEQMTCEQAVGYFEKNGVIYKTANGNNVLPIRQGTPIRKAGGLRCGHDRSEFRYSLKTRDNPRCVISAYCG